VAALPLVKKPIKSKRFQTGLALDKGAEFNGKTNQPTPSL
jgi:hypothetical protein